MSETLATRSESWDKVKEGLGARQGEVLAQLEGAPSGLTAWEIANKIHRLVHAVRPRLTEMRKLGLIECVGKRYYKPTDRMEAIWQVKVSKHDPDGQMVMC